MEINKIIPIHFDEWQKTQYIRDALTQWDRNMQLEISGLDISDETVEVHFSLEEISGGAKRNLGTVENGVISVKVPAFILEGPEYVHGDSYCAWAWVYVSDKESSETIRKIYFTIEARPKPEEYETPEELSFLQQLENEIKKKVNSSGHEPNKYLGTDESGNVVTKDQEEFRLEVAGEEKLGGVKPVTKSDSMTQEVGVDKQGKLYTEPSSIDEETLLKLAIKQTTEKAAFHNIQNSAAYRVLDFGMEGKTEQESSPGNQLFDISKFKSGLYVTNNGDGSITLTRYAVEGSNYISEVLPTVVAGQTIVFSATNPGSFIYFGGVVKKFGSSFEVTQEMLDSNLFGFYGISDVTTADNPLTISDIMINEGTTALPYEPYTNGPTPNPDYPQEIVNAGVYNEETGRYKHKFTVGNKNLWNISELTADTGNHQVDVYIAKDFIVNATKKDLVVASEGWVFRFIKKDGKSLYAGTDNYSLPFPQKITATEENPIVAIAYRSSIISSGSYTDIQMEIEDAPTDFTEHQSQPFTLTSPVPLTKWDYLTKRDGVWGWSINSYETICDGNDDEPWKLFNVTDIRTVIRFAWYSHCKEPVRAAGKQTVYCSHYQHYTGNTNIWNSAELFNAVSGTNSIGSFYFSVSPEFTTLDVWKAWLAENPITVLYQTETEQAFHPLPDEEQELLNNLETYYGVTNMYNDQGCPMWIKYVADTKLYMDNQLLEIKSAIV